MVEKLLKRKGWLLLLLVFLVAFIAYSSGIGRSSIYILDESKNAQCAWEMMHSSDHIVPTFNGKLRTDKPSLHYYAMMLGYSVWGKTPFAARVVSSLVGALLMVVFAAFVARYASRRVAFWSVVVLLSSIMWVTEFHLSVPDPYLIALVALGLMAFYHFIESRQLWSVLLMYLFFSLGFLAKGPIAVGLPGLIVLLHLLGIRQLSWKTIWQMQPVVGLAIFAVVALPWYYMVHVETAGEWTRGFFLDHNINRFADTKEGHGGIFLITILYFLFGLLPFAVLVVGATKSAWLDRGNRLTRFASVVVLTFLLFFSISSTKLPNYAMPCFPFAAILLALYLDKLQRGVLPITKNVRVGLWILFAFSLLVPLVLTFGTVAEPLWANQHSWGVWLLFFPVGVWFAIRLVSRGEVERGFMLVFATFFMVTAIIHLVLIPKGDKLNPVQATLPMLQKAKEVRYFKTINPSYVTNFGLIKEMDDTVGVASYLSAPGNLLITSRKVVRRDSTYWQQFQMVYSAKDIFDNNHTVIFEGKGAR